LYAQVVASAACRMSRGAGGAGSGGNLWSGDISGGGGSSSYSLLASAVGSRTRAACRAAASQGEDRGESEEIIAEQLAALHKRHIYDTSVLLQKEREILAMASRKGSSMSVSYFASVLTSFTSC
jgi:hypothetical protein